ncbi:uncharacterized protein LOC122255359 [Penaeus japonicus]|uniref:uncharacterized protein LOC122255359 n=1 Tax=Penaeus japonicus TaxID=27405 RepID=UPI001C710FF1|nr:uncharacterized protein LOC122255359 [Penaeus japonicus]
MNLFRNFTEFIPLLCIRNTPRGSRNIQATSGADPPRLSPPVFLPLERYVIEQVMADIGRHSCARFVERTDQVDYVTIIYDRDKCYSHIGRVGGPQPLSLGFFCVRWWDQGTIYHELLHSLGFFHEHNRPDRDSYVEILWDNISWGQDKNFRKRSYSTVELIDLPYDFESVMHYNPYAFSKWYFLAPTIKSRAKGASFKRAKKPTAKDYNKLNRLYRCRREGRSHYSHLGYSGPSPRWFQDNGYNVSAIVPPPPPSTISSPRMIRDGSERHLSGAAGRSKASQFLDPISRLQFRGLPANPWLKNRAPTPRAQILTPRNFIVPTSTPQFRDRLPDSELTQIISSNTQINTLPQAITSKPWMSDFVENQYLLHFETRNLANDTDITTFNKSMTLAPTQVRLPDPAMTPLALTGRQVGQELRRLKSRTKSFPGRHRIISRNLP